MEILPFQYKENIEIRTFKDNQENIWFIGKDIAELLKYERPSNAISQHFDILPIAKARGFCFIKKSLIIN